MSAHVFVPEGSPSPAVAAQAYDVVTRDGGRSRLCHLSAAGTSVVLELPADGLPVVLHWGPALGELTSADLEAMFCGVQPHTADSRIYTQTSVSVLPQHSAGWLGRPGLAGSRSGRAWSVEFDEVRHEVGSPRGVENAGGEGGHGPDRPVAVRSAATDEASQLHVVTELELHASGVVRLRASVRNLGAPYALTALEPALPVPPEAVELLDMAGRHTLERMPQRRPFDVGAWVRESRGGRPGHDSGTLLCAGRQGFGFRSGRVWGVHLAYSGNQVMFAEHTFNGWRLLRAGELLMPGEVVLEEGESYTTPWLTASWGEGLDALSHRFHDFLRSRPQHPHRPRPVLLNTWEAVYFDHDLERLHDLAEKAAAVGVERFVLDDGWFRGRRDAHAGLGDWYVDEAVYPDGLHPLVDRVRELGMEFGLWFEPEMVNLDSDLARDHPEWLFDAGHGPGMPSRNQHELDLGHPEAYAYILGRLSSLVEEYRIDYVKWDHNRPLIDAGHQPDGVPGLHRHTAALYRMLAELRRRHPGLEIESCCGGGGRIDLGILEHTDRVWASDCNDPHDRQTIQRWTSLLLPPELVGAHIGPPVSHTTARAHGLTYRAGTALWGHLGIEWDLTEASPAELEELAAWVRLHREQRELLHGGTVVRADLGEPALRVEGVVHPDRRRALYAVTAVDRPLTWPPGRVPLPGLDPEARYHVQPQAPSEDHPGLGYPGKPPWMREGIALPGRVLGEVGIEAPPLHPDQLVLIRVDRVESTTPGSG